MTQHPLINCEEALARMVEFIDHELTPAERDAMEHHLHTCRSCFSRAEFERRLKKKLARLRDAAEPAARERIEKLIRSL